MAGLYDDYKLANSQLVKQYNGSPISQAVTNVARELQGRYDQTKENMDILGSAIDGARVASPDKKLFEETIQTYRDRISGAAKKGNYEDMVYDVNKMGREFASAYQPFAENQQRISAQLKQIDDDQRSGRISNEIAQAAKYKVGLYGGMKKGEDGKLTGEYQGFNLAKTVNIADWVAKNAKLVASHAGGSDIRTIQGEHYIERGNKWEKIEPQRLQIAIAEASKLDPEFQDSIRQDLDLKTLKYENYTKADIPKELVKRVEELAQANGTSIGSAYRQLRQMGMAQETQNSMMNLAVNNFAKNDVFTTSKIMGETEDAKRVKDAEFADKESKSGAVFGVPIIIPRTGSEYNTPDKLQSGITESKRSEKLIGENYNAWVNTHKVTRDGENYKLPDGTDVTHTALKHRLIMQQEKNKQSALQKLDNEAKAEARYKVSPETQALAKRAYDKELNKAIGYGSIASGGSSIEERKKSAMEAYNNVLRNTKNYAEYKKVLENKTQNMSMETIATRFKSKKDNDSIEDLINNMSSTDFENSLISAEFVGSRNGGKAFEPEHYNNLKGEIKFAGQAMDDKGEQVYIFKATDPKTKESTQFQMRGIISQKSMPQLTGADAGQFYAQQVIRTANSQPSKETVVTTPTGANVKIKAPDGKSGKYVLYYDNPKTGKKGQWESSTEDEISARLNMLINNGRR